MDFNNSNIETLHDALSRERLGMPIFPAVYSRHLAIKSLATMGQFNEAITRAKEGFEIANTVGHPLSELYMYMADGFLHAYRGEFVEAIRLLEHGLTMCEATGARLIFVWVSSYLGTAYIHSGRIADGISHLERAVERLTTLRVMLRRSLVVGWLSEAYLAAGRVGDAVDCAHNALGHARDQHEPGHEAEALRLLGEISICQGSRAIETAADSYRQAIGIAKELGMRPLLARCYLGLGRVHLQTGDSTGARGYLTTALDMFRAMGMQHWREKTEMELASLQAIQP
jgi:tetratricopeptide (TPR) repeat protein